MSCTSARKAARAFGIEQGVDTDPRARSSWNLAVSYGVDSLLVENKAGQLTLMTDGRVLNDPAGVRTSGGRTAGGGVEEAELEVDLVAGLAVFEAVL